MHLKPGYVCGYWHLVQNDGENKRSQNEENKWRKTERHLNIEQQKKFRENTNTEFHKWSPSPLSPYPSLYSISPQFKAYFNEEHKSNQEIAVSNTSRKNSQMGDTFTPRFGASFGGTVTHVDHWYELVSSASDSMVGAPLPPQLRWDKAKERWQKLVRNFRQT